MTLKQAKMDTDPRKYMSVAVFSGLFVSSLVFAAMLIVATRVVDPLRGFAISVSVGIVLFFAAVIYIMSYPKLLVKKRVKDADRNLMHALKHMLIHIKSGVPMYDSFVSLSGSGYGVLSEEFGELVKEVDSGTSMDAALDELAIRNPSQDLRRVIWQISNGLKAGSDMGSVIGGMIENMSKEKMLKIRSYGSELNPLTLVYMMIAVIIPALGVTMLIVLSSFSGIKLGEPLFLGILALVAFLQFMYMGIIKSRRPNI
jgi:flagellar protein FlaJ